MKPTLRKAQPYEAGAIRELVHEAYAPYVPRMGREPAPMLADYPALIEQGAVTVAEAEGILGGVLVCYARRDHLHVENVAVAPAAQGRGVGRALMRAAEAEARRQGLGAIELYTNEVMAGNFPFYAALGYAITGREVEEGYNRVFFRKELRD